MSIKMLKRLFKLVLLCGLFSVIGMSVSFLFASRYKVGLMFKARETYQGSAIYKHYLLPNISLNGTVERKFTKMKFGHLFIFGAVTGNHSKAQTINIVKIYGSLEKKIFGKSLLYCCFKFDNSVKRVTPIVKRLFQVPAGMWSFYLACPILIDSDEASATMSSTENKVPTNVAVTVDDYGCEEDDVAYVQPYRPWKMPGKIAIGSKTSFGTIDPELIIEWMEAYKYMGVDKVVTYIVRTINADALNVLKYYESTGFLDLSFYDLAGEDKYPRLLNFGKKHNQRWNDQQVVVDDAFERMSGYQYFGIIDHDEFLVPSKNRTLKEVLSQLDRRYPSAANYILSSQYYFLSWGKSSNQSDMILGSFTKREERGPRIDNAKNICMPPRVALGGIDTHLIKQRYGYKTYRFPIEDGYIRHYRGCRVEKLQKCMNQSETTRVEDNEVADWAANFAENVANVRKRVLGRYCS